MGIDQCGGREESHVGRTEQGLDIVGGQRSTE